MTSPLLPLLLMLAFVPSAFAQNGRDADRDEAQGRSTAAHQGQQDRQSLADTVRRVERATGGQILSAERVPFDGRDMNRVKVVDSTGRVRVITEDPRQRRGRGRPKDD